MIECNWKGLALCETCDHEDYVLFGNELCTPFREFYFSIRIHHSSTQEGAVSNRKGEEKKINTCTKTPNLNSNMSDSDDAARLTEEGENLLVLDMPTPTQ